MKQVDFIGFSQLYWWDEFFGVIFDDDFEEYLIDATGTYLANISNKEKIELFYDWFEEQIDKELK